MTSKRSPQSASPRLSIEEAVAALVASVEVLDEETIAVDDACGRTTARPVAAAASVPDVHVAAMDGIAVRAADLEGAGQGAPVELSSDRSFGAGGFAWIDTGQALQRGADAVVMVERVEQVAEAVGAPDGTGAAAGRRGAGRSRRVRVREAPAPWSNVRVVGEDVVVGERLLPAGHRIGPADLGLLLAAGVHRVALRRAPVVAILPTGDELVEPGAERPPGTTIESNSRVLAEMLRARGAVPLRLPRVRDDARALALAVADAAERADVVCTIAGSSAGSRDWTATAFASVGRVLATGIGLVPGRPTILASLTPTPERRARVAIGLPGYPIAAAMVAREILGPLVARLLGEPQARPATREAVAAEAIPSRSDLEELVRVEVARIGGRAVVHPLARGAGALSSLARAAGLVRLRPGTGGIAAGASVAVEDLSAGEAPFTLLLAGLADPAVDALEDALRARGLAVRVALRPCADGAAAALLAAGTVHGQVWARPSGGVARAGFASGRSGSGAGEGETFAPPAAVAAGRGREFVLDRRSSGLVVARGNPLGITGPADAASDGVRGLPMLKRGGVLAGARPLDVLALSAPPPGHADERGASAPLAAEIPPLAAAALVAAGVADVAIGTAGTAAAVGADFVAMREDEVVLRIDAAGVDASLLRAIEASGSGA